MSDKLKPCPFCGGMNLYYAAGRFYAVECSDCGAKVVGAFRTEEEAAEAWNNRVLPPFTPDELDAIRRNVRDWRAERELSKIEQSIIDKCDDTLKGVRYDTGNV
nr:MAG TPA: restriction alleviation protein [Caudoviricetes sp.]